MERIRKETGLTEKILSYVPGYRGYREKELRRETDILVRRKVSGILAEARSELNSPLGPSEAGLLANDPEARFLFETVRSLLDKATQRIDKAVSYWAASYLAILLLNPLTGPSIGVQPSEFAAYLFGLTPISSFNSVSCPFLCPPFAVSYLILTIIQPIMLIVSRRAVRRVG
ncbi:MAG: hypothetical protein QXK69_08275 [Candidatus Caldarchaeum sp.]